MEEKESILPARRPESVEFPSFRRKKPRFKKNNFMSDTLSSKVRYDADYEPDLPKNFDVHPLRPAS